MRYINFTVNDVQYISFIWLKIARKASARCLFRTFLVNCRYRQFDRNDMRFQRIVEFSESKPTESNFVLTICISVEYLNQI